MSDGTNWELSVVAAPDRARTLKIADPDTYKVAAEELLVTKALRKQVDDAFDGIIEQAHATHKQALAKKKTFTGPLDEAEKIIKAEIGRYTAEEEAKRADAQRAADAAMRKREEERRLDEAQALVDEGKDVQAMHLLDEPVLTQPVMLAPAVQKVDGITSRDNWTFRITHPDSVSREFCKPDEVKIRAYVKAMKGTAQIPGVQVYVEKVIGAAPKVFALLVLLIPNLILGGP